MFTMLALAAIAFTACSKDEKTLSGGDMRIAVNPTIANPPIRPKAATRVTDTDFELNDAVGLRITMTADKSLYAANRKLTFDGTDFTATDFRWYEDVNLTSSLFAYYPYAEGDAVPTEFTVRADQSGEGYTQSDLIVAVKTGVKPTKSSTAMTFKHKTTRIIIDVVNESGSDVTGIAIKGSVPTGEIDTETGAFAAKTGVEASDVTAYTATADKLYYALLVPQNAVQLQVAVTTADGKTRTYTLGTTDLKSGENRRMSMNVQPADLYVKFSGAIDSWTDGDELLPDGEGSVDVPSVEWGGVKYRIVTLKDGRTWMAENLRYIPAGKTVSSDFAADADGIWYPLAPSYDEAAAKYVAVVSTDEAVIASNGYLYSFAAAMQVDAITEENSATFEGKQGICPDGWHIPSEAELNALIAAYPLPDDATKASMTDLAAAEFPCVLSGMRMKNTSAATGAVSGACYQDHIMGGYLMSSTKNSYTVNDKTQAITSQNKTLMFMSNASNTNGRISNASNLGGVPVRCIKDKE